MPSWTPTDLLPGCWVALLAALLAAALRRWYDPVPRRAWLVWGAALALLLGPALVGGRVLLPLGALTTFPPFTNLWEGPGPPPGNPLQTDLVLQVAPWLLRVREAWAAGAWPLWNHLAGAGEPLLGNPQSQALQPLVLLALPFPIAAAVGVVAALRVLAAFVFTFLLLRRQGLSEPAALAGSLAFGLSGFLLLWLGWPLAGSAALLPLLLYALVRADDPGLRRDRALLAVAVTCLLLVGHPETELHALALAAAFGASRLAARPPGRRLRLLGAWLVAGVLGAALAAPALLPAVAYLPQSLRAAVVEARQARLAGLAPLADPGALGRRAAGSGLVARLLPNAAPYAYGHDRFGRFWGERNVNVSAAGFAGTAALLGFLVAWAPARRRFPQERVALAAGALALVVLARPPGLPQLLARLPVVRSSLTDHDRIGMILAFAVAYAGACAWERRRAGDEGRVAPAVAAVAAAMLAGLLAWGYLAHPDPGDPAALAGLRHGALALQLATLAAAAWWMLRRPRRPGAGGWLLATLVAAELLLLHGPINPAAPKRLFYPETAPIRFVRERLDPWHRVAGLGPVLRPNVAGVYGLADPRSSNPAKPAAYLEAIRRIDVTPERPTDAFVRPEDPLWGLLGVRWVLAAPRERQPPPLRLALRRPTAWVWERPGALPRLFLPATAEPRVARAPARLELGRLEPARLSALAHLPEPRLLASSVYQDGGWRLLVDGARRPTILANGPFVAARLAAGERRLDLVYRPPGFVAGAALLALGLAAGAALWLPPPSSERAGRARRTRSRSQTRTDRSA